MKYVKLFERFINEARAIGRVVYLDENDKIEHQPGTDTVHGGEFKVMSKNPFTKGSFLRIDVSNTNGFKQTKSSPDLYDFTTRERILKCVWMLSETSESIIELILEGEVIETVKIDRNNPKATAKKMWKLSSQYMGNSSTENDWADILKLWIDLTDEFPRK